MLKDIYRQRFGADRQLRRNKLWETLCRYWFQRYVRPADVVLDLAAGHCEFINNIKCATKIAVDLNEEAAGYANPDVRFVRSWSHNMVGVDSDSVDVVFVSNFFEHLPDKKSFLDTLAEIRRVLKPGGQLLILQPNIRFVGGEYWDFVDHYLPLTDRTLVEALGLVDLEPITVRPRFLPYTTQSRLPQSPWLVWAYLQLPVAHRFLGKQAFVVARKPAAGA
jgi:ubiquinone/menaquinone biosynthesis C-methylase UbiE